MITTVGRRRWKSIENFPLPMDILSLVKLCEEFEELILRIDKIAPYINSELFRDAVVIFMRVVNKYIEIMDQILTVSKDRDAVLSDIHKSLKFLYDRDGKFDITSQIISVKTIEEADMVRKTFLTPAIVFINTKIYDPLVESIYNARISMIKDFLNRTFKRRGIIPETEEDIAQKFKLGGRWSKNVESDEESI